MPSVAMESQRMKIIMIQLVDKSDFVQFNHSNSG